jgi:hypothetical protein
MISQIARQTTLLAPKLDHRAAPPHLGGDYLHDLCKSRVESTLVLALSENVVVFDTGGWREAAWVIQCLRPSVYILIVSRRVFAWGCAVSYLDYLKLHALSFLISTETTGVGIAAFLYATSP